MTAFAPPEPAVDPSVGGSDPSAAPLPALPVANDLASVPGPAEPGAAPVIESSPPLEDGAPPPPAADPFQVESIVAAIGVGAFVDKSLKRIHLYQLTKAAKIDDEINRKIYLFLGRESPEPTSPLPSFDFESVRDALTAYRTPDDPEVLPDDIAKHIEAFGELSDVGLAAVGVVARIVNYAKPKIPRRVHMSLAGPIQSPPPHSDVARFRRLWAIACNPLSILDDLNEYAVSRDMAQAVFDLYPLVFQHIDQGVTAQLLRKKAVAPDYRLSIRKEGLLRILIRKEDPSFMAMGIALQAQFAAQAAEAQPKPPQKKAAGGASSESSAADRIGTA